MCLLKRLNIDTVYIDGIDNSRIDADVNVSKEGTSDIEQVLVEYKTVAISVPSKH